MSNKKELEKSGDAADALEGQLIKFGVKTGDYGLCSSCTNLRLIKREFGHAVPECRDAYYDDDFFRPSAENPVTECSRY